MRRDDAHRSRRLAREGECGDLREEEKVAACTIGPGRRRGRSVYLGYIRRRSASGSKCGDTREEEKCRRFCYEPREEVGFSKKPYLP